MQKAFIPVKGQKLKTSAVPPKLVIELPTYYTHQHAYPTVNGRVPVDAYFLSVSGRPRKSIQ